MEGHQTPPSGEDELRAEMTAAAINDLPDSDFAYIEDGGKKDAEGKTVPRSLRHFPIHDEAHVRNALSRAPQSPFGDKAMPKIKAAAKKFGVDVADDSGSRSERNPALTAGRQRRRERRRAVALLPEHRYFNPGELEIRSTTETDEINIGGSPVKYATSYEVVDPWGRFEERVHAGSVTDLLARGVDCRLLLNHDGMPMARTTADTMDLWDTEPALRFAARLDARQQLANDFAIAIQRRDITQMSVGMIVGQDEWGVEDGMETRDIFVLKDLLDVSGVTYPCSPTTSIEVAQRMALAIPVESRARLRRLYADLRAGRDIAPDRVEGLRALLDADLDPGEETQTPEGTGRLGHPDGTGPTWANEGDLELPDATPADGTEGGQNDAMQPPDDGTGSRSATTSRLTRIRVQRALRGL